MAQVKNTRICKVCGKEYEYCHTYNSHSKFRYQDVACCPAHGAEYFAQIQKSRAKKHDFHSAEAAVPQYQFNDKAEETVAERETVLNEQSEETEQVVVRHRRKKSE